MNIPERKDVAAENRWKLDSLFSGDQEWEKAFAEYRETASRIPSFKGSLGASAENLKSCLDFMTSLGMGEEKLGHYAQLRLAEDGGDPAAQDRYARFLQAAAAAEADAGYQKPEILAIPDERMTEFLETLPDYRISLGKLLRFKPHILSEEEERLLALQTEANETARKAYSALTDVDMDFGLVPTPEGEKPLTQSTFQSFLMHPLRGVREAAYTRFMGLFDGHKNTLAALLAGSVQLDIYSARVRRHPSARAARLFPDDVPEAVYDNLVEVVHRGLPALHRYYELRRRVLGLEKLRMYDTKTPLVPDIQVRHSYPEAVEVVVAALAPLGPEYQGTLRRGLLGGWVDRYENRGKRSGAFSAGSYTGDPYILMNYKEDLLRDVFTLAHEAGHSMHSLYSAASNPFQHYDYTIFEAEVASTFNEQLLMKYFMDHAESEQFRAYLVGKQIDDLIGTLFRQTMFAEYEQAIHRSVEEGRPLTTATLRSLYRDLLGLYFGPALELMPLDDLEGLRIPHFYRAFYVYKYATGIAAAVALSRMVLTQGEPARERYFAFLRSGGSRFPLEALRIAGVDMSVSMPEWSPGRDRKPEPGIGPVEGAVEFFSSLVEELEAYLS